MLFLGLAACDGPTVADDAPRSSDAPRLDAPGSDDVPARDAPLSDAPASLERVASVTHHGVTWTFAEPAEVGRYVTGDYFAVGPVTVTAIDPSPAGGRNGSVVNPPPVDDRTGFDDRTEAGRYDASLGVTLPVALAPGDVLASSISVDRVGETEPWLREGSSERAGSPVRSVSLLTVVAAAPAADAFRPSWGNPSEASRRVSELDLTLLPSLAPPMPVDGARLEDFARRFERPWIDNLFFGFDAQIDYMPSYGREMGRAAGEASLLVMLDVPASEAAAQRRLLVGLVQRGIDLYGLLENGHPGWSAFGGHGSGRKWPIVFAGLLLHDAAMSAPRTTFPEARFGEDMHTAYAADLGLGPAWNGATVVYTGHQGVWAGRAVSSDPAWGPYEHLAPSAWLDDIGESYRRCCTSVAWVGEALAARLMRAQSAWGHDAFFDYVDRWMSPEGDAAYTETIFAMSGFDFRAAWAAHGSTWDRLTGAMWETYR